MASYQVLSQEGEVKTVVLTADDGYSETQKYVGDDAVLTEAARHFNAERLASVAPPTIPEPLPPVTV